MWRKESSEIEIQNNAIVGSNRNCKRKASQTYLTMKSSLRNTTAVIIEKNGQVSMLLLKVQKGFTYGKFKCTAKK